MAEREEGMREQSIDPILARALYESALDEGDWWPALERLRNTLSSSEATLAVFDSRQPPAVETTREFLTAETCKPYLEHYGRIDPKNAYFSRASSGFVFNDARCFDDGFVSRNCFYQEYTIPIGLRRTLDLLLEAGDGRNVFLAVMRSDRKGYYEEGDEAALRVAGPHFLRVLAVRERLSAAETAARVATGALDQLSIGILLFDPSGRIILANAAALEMCGNGGCLRICKNRLVADPSAATAEIEAAVRQAAGSCGQVHAMRIGRREDEALLAWFAPMPASSPLNPGTGRTVLAIIAGPAQKSNVLPEQLRRLYGLTAAEAELAIVLAGGVTLAEAARRRGIKLSTTRTQLLSILQKLGIHRQSDLVRLVARLPGALLQ
ncbi:MAG TPA: PAS domain-containing protein [Allosphingosinicella sp.]|nr:PAS domain-containing protein [Allosphingosinicella sp.]